MVEVNALVNDAVSLQLEERTGVFLTRTRGNRHPSSSLVGGLVRVLRQSRGHLPNVETIVQRVHGLKRERNTSPDRDRTMPSLRRSCEDRPRPRRMGRE